MRSLFCIIGAILKMHTPSKIIAGQPLPNPPNANVSEILNSKEENHWLTRHPDKVLRILSWKSTGFDFELELDPEPRLKLRGSYPSYPHRHQVYVGC